MIPTAIGTRTKDNNQTQSTLMQSWLENHGLSVYTPQLRHGEAANLSAEWDAATGGLKWRPATIAHLASLPPGQMLMSYNWYFYGSNWRTVAWEGRNQDELQVVEMARYLDLNRKWLEAEGIMQPWIHIDEPPHLEKYGLSPAIEDRVIRFATACLWAGWDVWVTVPHPAALAYWVDRLPEATGYILHESHDWAAWAARVDQMPSDVWLYNVRAASLPNLAARLRQYNATGMLMWSAVPWTKGNDMPLLFDLSDPAKATPTDAAWQLLRQVQAYDARPPLSEADKLARLWAAHPELHG